MIEVTRADVTLPLKLYVTAACVHMGNFSCVVLMNETKQAVRIQSAALLSVRKQVSPSPVCLYFGYRMGNMNYEKAPWQDCRAECGGLGWIHEASVYLDTMTLLLEEDQSVPRISAVVFLTLLLCLLLRLGHRRSPAAASASTLILKPQQHSFFPRKKAQTHHPWLLSWLCDTA